MFFNKSRIPPMHDVYVTQLAPLGYGFPLYSPQPWAEGELVRIGDVGYIEEGQFIRLFNILVDEKHDWNKNMGVPDGFVALDTTFSKTKKIDKFFDPGTSLHCHNVKETKYGAAAGSAVPPVEGRLEYNYEFFKNGGAVLFLGRMGHKEDAISRLTFRNYLKDHFRDWLSFAADRHGISPQNGLILVTGVHRTAEWASAAYAGGSRRVTASLAAGVASVASGELAFSRKWTASTNVIHRTGPICEEPVTYDQTIFLRGFVTGVRSYLGLPPGPLKAAAEPQPPGPREPESDAPEILESGEFGAEDYYVNSITEDRKDFHPADALIEWALEHTSDDIVVVHDDDWCLSDRFCPAEGGPDANVSDIITDYGRRFFQNGSWTWNQSDNSGERAAAAYSDLDTTKSVSRFDTASLTGISTRKTATTEITVPDDDFSEKIVSVLSEGTFGGASRVEEWLSAPPHDGPKTLYDYFVEHLVPLGLGVPAFDLEASTGQAKICIGDVGYFQEGRFVRLFNITSASNHPYNMPYGVPEGFAPLSAFPDGQYTSAKHFDAGDCLLSPGVTTSAGDKPVEPVTPHDRDLRPSARKVLTQALELAREAVALDATNDNAHASVQAYGRAVALVCEVIECIQCGKETVESKRRPRSVQIQEAELRRLRSIRDTYTERMKILSMIHGIPAAEVSQPSVPAKTAASAMVPVTPTVEDHQPHDESTIEEIVEAIETTTINIGNLAKLHMSSHSPPGQFPSSKEDLQFSFPKHGGTALVLLHGGVKENTTQVQLYAKYAKDNSASWFKFTRGLGVEEQLIVITGHIKTAGWTSATYMGGQQPTSITFSGNFEPTANGERVLNGNWDENPSVITHDSGPCDISENAGCRKALFVAGLKLSRRRVVPPRLRAG